MVTEAGVFAIVMTGMFLSADLLIKHANKFDRALAFLFYWLLMLLGLFMTGWALLDVSGIL